MRLLRIVAAVVCLTAMAQTAMSFEGAGRCHGCGTCGACCGYGGYGGYGAGAGGSWYANYYDAAWGMPVALVVPPTAEYQSHYGSGVATYRVTPIYHQFQAGYPGPSVYNPQQFQPTPPWPTDTDQFGVYYVRGPW
jgi:hypothetical protein